MDELVRVAAREDIAELVRLETRAREALVDQRGGPEHLTEVPLNGVAGFDSLVVDTGSRLTLATIDDAPVGYAHTARRENTAQVVAIYVEPEARELGLGELLLADAIEWATNAGADYLEAVALPGDRETKNMYERFGIKARALIVSTHLTRALP